MMARLLAHRAVPPVLAVAVAAACGYAVVSHVSLAILLALVVVVVVGLVVLGPRAYPSALVLVAVAPWYTFVSDVAGPPLVQQRVFCGVIVGALLLPWLWAVGTGPTRRRPSARVGLYGCTFLGLAVAIHETLGAFKPMIDSGTVGLLVGGIAFVAARRFSDPVAWGAAATLGIAALVLMGLAAEAMAPGARVGYFSGYPITYGALVIGLLPMALVWLGRRSRLLAAGMGTAACGVLVLSESRSSWIACVLVLTAVVALLFRQRRWRQLRAVGGLALLAGVLIWSTGSLNGIVERQLSPKVAQSDSVTHRTWSYGYAIDQIRQRPFFGAGAPGYAAKQSAAETDIGALDNGYLSVLVDSGLFGFAAVFVPIAVALQLLAGWFWRRLEPEPEVLAMALGIVGMAVVTVFYDSFYWAQISLLLFAFGGALSAQPRVAFAQLRTRRLPSAPSRELVPLGGGAS